MWEIFSPIFLKLGVTLVVETIVIFIYYMVTMPEFFKKSFTQEEIMQISVDAITDIYQYATEIAALSALAAIPFLLIMFYRDKRKDLAEGIMQNKRAPLGQYVFVIFISMGVSLGLNNILILSNLAEYSEAYQEVAETLYLPSFPVQILCVGIIIPIMEELIFRGLIYKRIRRSMTPTRAMIFSAMFFGLYHGNTVQFIYATLTGALLAYMYEKYGSLKAPILAHMLMNVVACALTEADVFTWMFSNTIRMAIITVLCAAIASAMFVMIQRIDEKPAIVEYTEES